MLTSSRIIGMIKAPATGVNAGKARFAVGRHQDVPSHAQFAADMADIQRAPATVSAMHPADAVRGNTGRHKQLEPSDLLWLQRLPQDPAKVPFEDAVTVAGMHEGLARNQPIGSSDRRLIDSVWRPIEAHHDQRAAAAALTNAARPLPSVPASALPALADAIAAEVPSLSDAEVMARAQDALRQALEERSAAHTEEVQKAQQHAADIKAAAAGRTALTA